MTKLGTKQHSLSKKIILALFSTLIALVLGDFVLRTFFPVRYPLTVAWVRQWRYHPVLGWETLPNFAWEGEGKITNERGLRGRAFPYERREGAGRILILGDSFGFGYGVADSSACFTELLMSEYLKDVEVVNGSCSGYGTDQEYLFYLNEGSKYKPDLVVLIFYPNDFIENMLKYDNGLVHPNYRLDESGELVLENVPVPITNGWGREWVQPSSLREWLFLNSRIYNFYQTLLVSRIAEGQPDGGEDINFHPSGQVMANAVVTLKILEKLKEVCDANGSKLLIVTVPYLQMIDDSEWAQQAAYWKIPPNERFEPYEQFFAPLKLKGVHLLHLSREFLVQQRLGNICYDYGHRHWNPDGHRFIAKRISEYVSENGLIQKSE